MKITKVDAVVLRLPTITADVDGTQDDLIVRIETDEGLIGYGEVDSSPYPVKAIIDTPSSHGISYGLRELLLGEDPLHIEQLWRKMYEKTSYYGRSGPVLHAMSGVDMALWDISGKAHQEPIYRMFGACYRKRVMAYASTLMPDTPEAARAQASQFRQQGFLAMKFGWGPIGKSLAADRKLFEAVREGAGADARIMIDAGQTYNWKEARQVSEWLLELNTTWLEEPLNPDDLDGYARLAATARVPIAAGEAETGFRAFQRLILEGGVDIVQPDLSRCGGFSEARKIGHLSEMQQRRVIPHAFKSNILLAASLQFCAATPSADMIEYSMSTSPIRCKLTGEQFPVVDGYVDIPDRPGLGVTLNPEVLDELDVDKEHPQREILQ